MPNAQSEAGPHFCRVNSISVSRTYVSPFQYEQAVAVGAAVQGHILAQGDARTGGADLAGTTDLLLLDVTPLSLGIELEGREMSVLIKRNTTIPCRKSRSYTTVEDWQTSIDVVVYEVRGSGL